MIFHEVSSPEIVREYFYRSYRVVRIWMLIALILYALFGLLDEYLLPESKLEVWIIRYVFAIPLMSILILISRLIRENKKQLQVIVLLFVVTGVAGLCLMIATFSPTEKAYHVYFIGLLAAMSWCQIIGFDHKTFTLTSLGIWVSYNIVAVVAQRLHEVNIEMLLFNNLFFVTFGAFGFYSSRITERFIVEDHEKTKSLNEERIKLLEKQNELAETNAFKNKLLSVIANDVRSHLPCVKDIIHSHALGTITEGDSVHQSKVLLRQIEPMSILLDTIVAWSMVHSSSHTLDKKNINLNQLIDVAVSSLSEQAAYKALVIKNEVDPKMEVYADPGGLSIVLRNLLNFSIHKSEHAKALAIKAVTGVCDSEIVIASPTATIESIRDQTAGARTRQKGTVDESSYNFGLKVCFELIRIHGGVLAWLPHQFNDSNVTFYLTLPSHHAAAPGVNMERGIGVAKNKVEHNNPVGHDAD